MERPAINVEKLTIFVKCAYVEKLVPSAVEELESELSESGDELFVIRAGGSSQA